MKNEETPSMAVFETSTPSAQPAPRSRRNRRSFLKNVGMAGLAVSAGALIATDSAAQTKRSKGTLSAGDAAILQFLAAAELIESDLWLQYTELGGTQDAEEQGVNGGSVPYQNALAILDGDMAQYIHDNTDDELSHAAFINQYLISRGASPVSFNGFYNLPSSKATGAKQMGRLTNLMNLTVDTSFWTRYRSSTQNPDLAHATFPQAVTIVNRTAIPRTDDDLLGPATVKPFHIPDHLKAIAFTAGFHFCSIEQGGTTLYPALAQRVTDVEALRVLLSIGPTEAMHFQTWQDKAGNTVPLTDVDPVTGSSVTFPDLTNDIPQPESLQSNLIMPEPCPFLNPKFPACSIVRPTQTAGIATGVVKFLVSSGLFIGQSPQFFSFLRDLARAADAAQRGF
ncbi:MAG TPA: ferritin-like domain-containing protein [Terriglobales bacterium]|nr:ferritin-like domain-containing protein [Terriglobales bacterium]